MAFEHVLKIEIMKMFLNLIDLYFNDFDMFIMIEYNIMHIIFVENYLRRDNIHHLYFVYGNLHKTIVLNNDKLQKLKFKEAYDSYIKSIITLKNSYYKKISNEPRLKKIRYTFEIADTLCWNFSYDFSLKYNLKFIENLEKINFSNSKITNYSFLNDVLKKCKNLKYLWLDSASKIKESMIPYVPNTVISLKVGRIEIENHENSEFIKSCLELDLVEFYMFKGKFLDHFQFLSKNQGKSLKKLSIKNPSDLDDVLLNNLEKLDLSGLTSLVIGGIFSYGSRIEDFLNSLSKNPPNLENLVIVQNIKFEPIKTLISKMPNLKSLTINTTTLAVPDINYIINTFTKLEKLDLSFNKMYILPSTIDSFSNLKNLKELILKGWYLSKQQVEHIMDSNNLDLLNVEYIPPLYNLNEIIDNTNNIIFTKMDYSKQTIVDVQVKGFLTTFDNFNNKTINNYFFPLTFNHITSQKISNIYNVFSKYVKKTEHVNGQVFYSLNN